MVDPARIVVFEYPRQLSGAVEIPVKGPPADRFVDLAGYQECAALVRR
jgi:hypothetical protein